MNSAGESSPKKRTSAVESKRKVLEIGSKVFEGPFEFSVREVSLEQAVRDAGVARSVAYRLWPDRTRFFADLVQHALEKLADQFDAESGLDTSAALEYLERRRAKMATVESRRQLLAGLLEALALRDIRHVSESLAWAQFLRLKNVVESMAPTPVRQRAIDLVARVEQIRSQHIAERLISALDALGFAVAGNGDTVKRMVDVSTILIRGGAAKIRENVNDSIGLERDIARVFSAMWMTNIETRDGKEWPAMTIAESLASMRSSWMMLGKNPDPKMVKFGHENKSD